ncbi:MAG: LamG domain-containing protein [Byssovorax sp.]
MRRQPRSWTLVWLSTASALTLVVAVSCSHDWDGYDPRLGAASSSGSSAGTGGATSVGATTSGAVASSSSGSGGAGGAGPSDAGTDADADAAAPTYRDIILGDGPLAYWRFGESQGPILADELGMHPGTASLKGLTYGVSGLIAGDTAMSFDGQFSTINVAGGWDFAGLAPYSLEVWVKLVSETTSYPRIISKETKSGPRGGYSLLGGAPADGGSPFFGNERWENSNDILSVYFHGPVSPLQWTHVVARFDGDHGAIFVNGALVNSYGTPADAGLLVNSSAFLIGTDANLGSHFAGSLDEMAVYGKALTDLQIANHHAAGVAGL